MDNPTPFSQIQPTAPLDYLVVGHVTADLIDSGVRLGGTVTFSGLTAHAMGLRTGIVTSHAPDLDVSPIESLWVSNKHAENTTTFKNISDGVHRKQYLYQRAENLTPADIPALSKSPAILHLGPVANEVDPDILAQFPESLKCLTPQGWLRQTNADHMVHHQAWEAAEEVLAQSDAAVVSLEDVQYDEATIGKLAAATPVFVVTENYKGARVYWHNDARYFNAPKVKYGDDTGAGDIFATAFFYRYFKTRDPWEAGRFAVQIASHSVTRQGLESIPTAKEIERAKTEVLNH